MSIHEAKNLTVNNFSSSQNLSSSDKYPYQLADIGRDSLGFGCEIDEVFLGQSNRTIQYTHRCKRHRR